MEFSSALFTGKYHQRNVQSIRTNAAIDQERECGPTKGTSEFWNLLYGGVIDTAPVGQKVNLILTGTPFARAEQTTSISAEDQFGCDS